MDRYWMDLQCFPTIWLDIELCIEEVLALAVSR